MTLADLIHGYPLTTNQDDIFLFGAWLHYHWREEWAHYNDESRRLTLQSFGNPEYVAAVLALRSKLFWSQCIETEHQHGSYVFRLPRTEAWLAAR